MKNGRVFKAKGRITRGQSRGLCFFWSAIVCLCLGGLSVSAAEARGPSSEDQEKIAKLSAEAREQMEAGNFIGARESIDLAALLSLADPSLAKLDHDFSIEKTIHEIWKSPQYRRRGRTIKEIFMEKERDRFLKSPEAKTMAQIRFLRVEPENLDSSIQTAVASYLEENSLLAPDSALGTFEGKDCAALLIDGSRPGALKLVSSNGEILWTAPQILWLRKDNGPEYWVSAVAVFLHQHFLPARGFPGSKRCSLGDWSSRTPSEQEGLVLNLLAEYGGKMGEAKISLWELRRVMDGVIERRKAQAPSLSVRLAFFEALLRLYGDRSFNVVVLDDPNDADVFLTDHSILLIYPLSEDFAYQFKVTPSPDFLEVRSKRTSVPQADIQSVRTARRYQSSATSGHSFSIPVRVKPDQMKIVQTRHRLKIYLPRDRS